ncbi:MAG: hypothetical protein ACREDU_04235 [Methylocella sp.]
MTQLATAGFASADVRNDIMIGGGNIVLDQIREAIRRNVARPERPSSGPR